MVVVVKTPPQADYGSQVKTDTAVSDAAPNARQGVTGHNVRAVLAASLLGVIVLFAVVYLFFFAG